MNWTKKFHTPIAVAAIIGLTLIGSFLPAKSESGDHWWKGEETDAPGGRTPAGTRRPNDRCPNKAIPVTALVPAWEETRDQQQVTQVLGLTTKANPTLWFYIPDLQENIQSVQLFLLDNEGENVIKDWIVDIPNEIPESGGIVHQKISFDLETDKQYKWELYVNLDCGSESSTQKDYVYGWVKRIDNAELENKLNSETNPLNRFELYFDERIWHDALTELANLRSNTQDNIEFNQAWDKLFNSLEWDVEEEKYKDFEATIREAPIISRPPD